jgi:hypothetical protein
MATLAEQITMITHEWANERIHKAKAILKRYDINEDTNQLPLSIITKQKNTSTGVLIEFYANDYYIYVDQGVQGIGFSSLNANKEANTNKYTGATFGSQKSAITTGKYKYKTPYVSREMVESISQWISKKKIPIKTSKTQSTQSVINKKMSLSFAIAKNIKRTGIGKTLFWSDTFNDEAYNDLADRIGKKLGKDFNITIGI